MRKTGTGLLAAVAIFVAVGACTTDSNTDQLKWELSPSRGEIAIGGAAPFTITVESKANINSDLELTTTPVNGIVSSLPASVTSTASTIEGSFYAAPGIEPGAYSIDVNVREEGTEYGLPQTFLLTVSQGGDAPDFSLEVDPIETTVNVETGRTFTFYVRPLNGFSGTVAIALTGLTDDLELAQALTPPTLDFPPASGGKGGTFVLRYQPTPPVTSPVVLTVTATAGSLSHSRTITLTLPGASVPGT